jgi:hypothetical protein
MADTPTRVFGIPWCRREDWSALIAIFADAVQLPATYEKWLYAAQKVEKKIQSHGGIAERVYLDPGEFSAWCRTRGLDINADARMEFADEFVGRKYRNHG